MHRLALRVRLGELRLALLVTITAVVDLLHEGLDVNLLLILLFLFDCLGELLDLILQLGILFLLHHELPHQELPVIFLGLEVLLELCVPLDEETVLVVNPLGNGCDELKVMLHFILSFLQISFLIAFE